MLLAATHLMPRALLHLVRITATSSNMVSCRELGLHPKVCRFVDKWCLNTLKLGVQSCFTEVVQGGHFADIHSQNIERNGAENGGIGHATTSQSVGAVRATRVFARNSKAFHFGVRVGIDDHAAHEVMSGWSQLDLPQARLNPLSAQHLIIRLSFLRISV
ncbi:MAG: hypothetical protein AB8B51_13515 [Sedimentitalea sp.]